MERQGEAERAVVPVDAERDAAARPRGTGPGSRPGAPGEAFSTARPSPKDRTRAGHRDREPLRGAAAAAAPRSASRGPRGGARAAARRGRPSAPAAAPIPATFSAARSGPADLRRGHRQDVEVEREEEQDGDEVHDALEDDRREAGAGGDGMIARDQVRPDDLTRARDEQPGHEPDDGGGEQRGKGTRPSGASRKPHRQARAM